MTIVLKNCVLLLITTKDVLLWEALIEISQVNVLRNPSYVPLLHATDQICSTLFNNLEITIKVEDKYILQFSSSIYWYVS